MTRAHIKICGITTIEDARLACDLGADWLGFNFYRPSPRYIGPRWAADIIAELPPAITKVGVFVNASIDAIRDVLEQCPLDVAQLHGDESPDDCRRVANFGVGVMKAVRVRRPDDIRTARIFPTQWILLDAFHEELYGGSGDRFNWDWLRDDVEGKVFLAGGIGPDNIADALAVGAWGVDLCSGVEAAPGRKDPGRMKRLFAAIKDYYAR